jgi:hypothetical protein
MIQYSVKLFHIDNVYVTRFAISISIIVKSVVEYLRYAKKACYATSPKQNKKDYIVSSPSQ